METGKKGTSVLDPERAWEGISNCSWKGEQNYWK